MFNDGDTGADFRVRRLHSHNVGVAAIIEFHIDVEAILNGLRRAALDRSDALDDTGDFALLYMRIEVREPSYAREDDETGSWLFVQEPLAA